MFHQVFKITQYNKKIPNQQAIELSKLFFLPTTANNNTPLLPFPQAQLWLNFLSECKVDVSCDTWNLLCDFGVQVDNEMKGFKEDDMWPVLIDDFVAYVKSQMQ